MSRFTWIIAFFGSLLLISMNTVDTSAALVRAATGADRFDAALLGQVAAFQNDLGNPINLNAPGPLPGGRREINWDGGGGVVTSAVTGTPLLAFQNTRGGTFGTPGSGFIQGTPTGLATQFGNPTYTAFDVFTLERLFTPIGSNITEATFSIPGSPTTPATISGFGAIFSDVDLANTTSIEFFQGSSSLGTFFVPALNNGLSFLGVLFDADERIDRLRITTGNSALGPNDGGAIDVVAMDDFFYSEPQVAPVPEPSTLVIFALGICSVAGSRLRRRRRNQELHEAHERVSA